MGGHLREPRAGVRRLLGLRRYAERHRRWCLALNPQRFGSRHTRDVGARGHRGHTVCAAARSDMLGQAIHDAIEDGLRRLVRHRGVPMAGS